VVDTVVGVIRVVVVSVVLVMVVDVVPIVVVTLVVVVVVVVVDTVVCVLDVSVVDVLHGSVGKLPDAGLHWAWAASNSQHPIVWHTSSAYSWKTVAPLGSVCTVQASKRV
jgi:hypothetical protein